MKVLITGTAGFIGSTLAMRLLARGDEVIGIDNLNDYYDVSLKQARLERVKAFDKFTDVRINIEDRAAMEQVFAKYKPQRVINLAAQAGVRYSLVNPHAYIDTNIVGFVNVLEGSRHHGVEHLVYASSSSVYGPWGRPDMALFMFTKNILAGKPIDVFNYGDHKRDFTYIDDIVEGVIRTLDKVATPNTAWTGHEPDPGTSKAPWRVYNIGNNNPCTLLRYIEILENCLGKKAQKNMLPLQPGDVPYTYADTSDLMNDVGYKPDTSVEVGIQRFVDWYRDYYKV